MSSDSVIKKVFIKNITNDFSLFYLDRLIITIVSVSLDQSVQLTLLHGYKFFNNSANTKLPCAESTFGSKSSVFGFCNVNNEIFEGTCFIL